MTNLLFYWKSLKTSIKSDRYGWLKFVDENLKCRPKQFWKYVSQFWKKTTDLIHLDIEDVLNKPRDIAEAFSKPLQSVYNSLCSGTFYSVN
jgi:hypothetical protein